jgi:hypothetical protein
MRNLMERLCLWLLFLIVAGFLAGYVLWIGVWAARAIWGDNGR